VAAVTWGDFAMGPDSQQLGSEIRNRKPPLTGPGLLLATPLFAALIAAQALCVPSKEKRNVE